jgi:glutathione synthase/RimK-type ligase-like ATP-grasp enzyme
MSSGRKRVLIVTPKATMRGFLRRVSSQMLLWGLEQAGFDWEMYNPWCEPPRLSRFHAALCWSRGHRKKNFPFHARRFEKQCASEGLPVINSIRGCSDNHSTSLRLWKQHGIPCADFTRFRQVHQIELEYPMILRVDNVHQGKQTFLVRNPEEAERAAAEQEAKSLEDASSKDAALPLNLAVRYVDTQYPDGLYRKRRCFVVGKRLVPRQAAAAPNWLVNLGTCGVLDEAIEEDRVFRRTGEPEADLVRRAGVLTGSEISAVDYTIRPDGRYIFWEVNRHFAMTGDPDYQSAKLDAATGRTPEERREDDESLGRAMAALVEERARN